MLQAELSRIEPREVLVQDSIDLTVLGQLRDRQGFALSHEPESRFLGEVSRFDINVLMGVEYESFDDALTSNWVRASDDCAECNSGSLRLCDRYSGRIAIARQTGRIVSNRRFHDSRRDGKAKPEALSYTDRWTKEGKLLGVLDRTATAMGARRLRHWMAFPLTTPVKIDRRLDAVTWLVNHPTGRAELRALLSEIYDLERLNGRVSVGNASPRDLWFIRLSLEKLPSLAERLRRL